MYTGIMNYASRLFGKNDTPADGHVREADRRARDEAKGIPRMIVRIAL